MLTQRVDSLDPLHPPRHPARSRSRRGSSSSRWPRSSVPTSCPSSRSTSPRASWRRATSSRRARIDFESQVQTDAARAAASAAVPPQYDFTTENAIAIAAAQQLAFEKRVARIDTTFSADLSADGRKTLLADRRARTCPTRAKATLVGLDAARLGGRPDRIRAGPRCDAARPSCATRRSRTPGRGCPAGWPASSTRRERMLAAELISPLVVPNSSFSLDLTDQARAKAAEAVAAGHRSRSARAR